MTCLTLIKSSDGGMYVLVVEYTILMGVPEDRSAIIGLSTLRIWIIDPKGYFAS